MNTDLCPCGSGSEYDVCCGPLIAGTAKAKTAEALMRSRYSAYVKKAFSYVYDTYHPDSKKHFSLASIEKQSDQINWTGLEVIGTEKGGEADKEGYVNFAASYIMHGQKYSMTERSYFLKLKDTWFYVSGETKFSNNVVTAVSNKIGRNNPCPCGSGKKYKKCCGAAK